VTRSWKLTSEDPKADVSAYFASVNYGKQHVFHDLNDDESLKTVQQLAYAADIILANYRVGQAERFGLDAKTVQQHNPKAIYANITGFGAEDDRPAFDVVLQAETGYMYMNGQADADPTKMPVALIDVLAAHQLKEGVLLALLQRERTGNGQTVEVSLFDAAISALTNQASNWLMAQHVPQRMGSLHPNIAPYGEILRTKDGRLVVLAVGSDKQFDALCSVLDNASLKNDHRFIGNQNRVTNRKALQENLAAKAFTMNSDELMKGLLEANVPAGLIRNMQEVFEDKRAMQMVNDADGLKRVSQIAFKLKG
jgi:crotonobetainyl-CoA:carnitine CoA-transferase CaiB-like acyl-CoA transferase